MALGTGLMKLRRFLWIFFSFFFLDAFLLSFIRSLPLLLFFLSFIIPNPPSPLLPPFSFFLSFGLRFRNPSPIPFFLSFETLPFPYPLLLLSFIQNIPHPQPPPLNCSTSSCLHIRVAAELFMARSQQQQGRCGSCANKRKRAHER